MHIAALANKPEAIRALAEMKGDLEATTVRRADGVGCGRL